MKGAPELAGRGPSARGFSNPLDVRTRRQPDRPIQVQVWFDVGRADVALTAVAGVQLWDPAVWPSPPVW